MNTTRACSFLALGLAMAAGPAFWPGYFSHDQVRSAIWLVGMGTLQAVGAACVLILEGLRLTRRCADWIGQSLEISLSVSDLPHGALLDSLYAVADEPEEIAVALRLRRQLLRAA